MAGVESWLGGVTAVPDCWQHLLQVCAAAVRCAASKSPLAALAPSTERQAAAHGWQTGGSSSARSRPCGAGAAQHPPPQVMA